MKRRFLAWLLCTVMLFNNALPVFATETTEHVHSEECSEGCTLGTPVTTDTGDEDDITDPETQTQTGNKEHCPVCHHQLDKCKCEKEESTTPNICPDCKQVECTCECDCGLKKGHDGECQPYCTCGTDPHTEDCKLYVAPEKPSCLDGCTDDSHVEGCPNAPKVETTTCPNCDATYNVGGEHSCNCADCAEPWTEEHTCPPCKTCGKAYEKEHKCETCGKCGLVIHVENGHECKCTCDFADNNHAISCHTHCGDSKHLITCSAFEGPECCKWTIENGELKHAENCITNCTCETAETCPIHPVCDECGAKYENGKYTHTVECSHYMCPNCNGKKDENGVLGHAEKCSEYVCPLCNEKGKHATTCEKYVPVIVQPKVSYVDLYGVINRGTTVYSAYVNGESSTANRNYNIQITEHKVIDGVDWVKFKLIGFWGGIVDFFSKYNYIPLKDIEIANFSIVEDTEAGVSVCGVPDGASLVVRTPEVETMNTIIENTFPNFGEYLSVVEFHDISIMDDDTKWQPDKPVTVTLKTTVPTDMNLRVRHILDEETLKYEDIADITVNEDGTISFETSSFSIFVVESFGAEIIKTPENTVSNGSTVNMYRNEEKYFVWQWNEPSEDIRDAYQGTWTVVSGEDNVRFEVYNSVPSGYLDGADYRFAYLWLKVIALEPGDSTLQFKYKDSDGVVKTESFNINVSETNELLYIDNQIAENGCLVPVFTDDRDTTDIEFEWIRDDNVTIYEDALEEPYAVNGAVNVSMDRGGVDNEDRIMTTYTVIAKERDIEIARASFTVPYGNEVINGSFEYPLAQAENTGFANGTKDLFWKTTMPADDDKTLAWDVEYLSNQYTSSGESFIEVFGIVKPAVGITTPNGTREQIQADFDLPDGNQLAEINGSNPGALHQDVLTYPGAEMYWNIAHRARNYTGNYAGGTPNYWNENAIDTMYVIIAPTAQVEHIKTQDQLNELINAAGDYLNGDQITREINGHEITYSIRKITGNHQQWRFYDNNEKPYIVGEGEYLTRYFFASGETFYDINHPNDTVTGTVGNLIDAVSFSDKMSYRIEYYKDGNRIDTLTEYGSVDLERGTIATVINREAANLNDSSLSGTTHVATKFNDITYPLTTVFDEVRSGHNVMQLYFETYGVTVTKEVEIKNYSFLSENEKEKLSTILTGYKAEFELIEKDGGGVVATAEVIVDSGTMLGSATFMNGSEKFLPDTSKTYIIKEKNTPTIVDLVYRSTTGDNSEVSGSLVMTHKIINNYEMVQYRDLTINKDYVSDTYKTLEPDQTFIFNIKGDPSDDITSHIDMTVVIPEDGEVTIKNLPVGDYNITEDENWSWRYSVSDVKNTGNSSIAGLGGVYPVSLTVNNDRVTFTNTRNRSLWMDGNTWCQNVWKPENKIEAKPNDNVIVTGN